MANDTPFDSDMTDITTITGIQAETKFMQERAFNVALLEVFAGARTGTLEEQQFRTDAQEEIGR